MSEEKGPTMKQVEFFCRTPSPFDLKNESMEKLGMRWNGIQAVIALIKEMPNEKLLANEETIKKCGESFRAIASEVLERIRAPR